MYLSLSIAILTLLVWILMIERTLKQVEKAICAIFAMLHKQFGVTAEDVAKNYGEYCDKNIDFMD